jgi:hypothetical protein
MGGIGIGFMMLITFIFALFTYEVDWTKALGFIGWEFILAMVTFAALIPIVGLAFPIIFHILWSPQLLDFFTIYPSWLTMLTGIVYGITAIGFNVLGTWAAIRRGLV